MAAGRTVDAERQVHSLHAYFLRPGDPAGADRLRRRPHPRRRQLHHPARRRDPARPGDLQPGGVVPRRRSRAPSTTTRCPTCPTPETLPTIPERARADARPSLDRSVRRTWSTRSSARSTTRYAWSPPTGRRRRSREPDQDVWLRADGTLPDDPLLHACVVAYASDLTLLDTAMLPHAARSGRRPAS